MAALESGFRRGSALPPSAYPDGPPARLVLRRVGTLALGPALHLLLAMCGTFFLGRRLGMERWGAWTAGACFGLGGYVLSCVNLLPLFQAAALAPWVMAPPSISSSAPRTHNRRSSPSLPRSR